MNELIILPELYALARKTQSCSIALRQNDISEKEFAAELAQYLDTSVSMSIVQQATSQTSYLVAMSLNVNTFKYMRKVLDVLTYAVIAYEVLVKQCGHRQASQCQNTLNILSHLHGKVREWMTDSYFDKCADEAYVEAIIAPVYDFLNNES